MKAPVEFPVNTSEQAPADRVQVAVDGVTDPPKNDDSVQATVPVGEEPATVAVHVVVAPMRIDEGEQTRVVVVTTWVTDTPKEPELPAL